MKYLASLLLLFATAAEADYTTVAVIDTGIDLNILKQGYAKGMCKMGHRDFTGSGSVRDWHGHGTNISGLIHKYAKGTKYCQVILKYYAPRAGEYQNMSRMLAAIKYAINIKVDIINISGGGPGFSAAERTEILRALNNGIKVVTAAGNERCDLDSTMCEYYPAMYDPRIVVVGNGINSKSRAPSSNWGRVVDVWIDGNDKVGDYGKKMTGTSQSTAIYTGKLVRRYVQSRRYSEGKHARSPIPIRGVQRYCSIQNNDGEG